MSDSAGCDDCAFAEEGAPVDLHEIHITVDTCDTGEFVSACEELQVKPIVIAYSHRDGRSKMSDPMTPQKFRGDEAAALREAKRISEALNFAGFYPVRCKIETTPANPIWEQGKGYFESHIGVVVPRNRIESLQTVAKSFQAHMSNNAFKDHGDTVTKMMTYRANARDTTPERFTQHMQWMRVMIESMADVTTDRLIVEYC